MDYLSTENQELVNRQYKVAVWFIFLFLVSVIIYLLIARFVAVNYFVPGSEKWAQPIYSGVLVLALVIVALRRFLLSQGVLRNAVSRGVKAALQAMMRVTIISAAAAEILGILGLLFYFLTGDYQYSWRLGIISIFLLLYSYPRRGEWERVVIAGAKAQTATTEVTRQPAKI